MMTRSAALEKALFKNRQKHALEKLRPTLPLLDDDFALADYSTSLVLDQRIRGQLAERRPTSDGELLVTSDLGSFEAVVREHFTEKNRTKYYVFMSHTPEMGALVLSALQVAQHAVELLLVDGDALYGCSEDTHDVVSLDRTVGDDETITYEFFRIQIPRSGSAD